VHLRTANSAIFSIALLLSLWFNSWQTALWPN